MSLFHSPSIVRNGLVLCLDAANPKSYPGTGTTWINLVRNSNDANLINGITYNSSNNGSLVFNGTNSTANLSSDGFNFSAQQTIIVILKPTEATADRRNPYNQAYGGYGTITHEVAGNFNYFHGTNGGNSEPYQGTLSSFTVAQNEIAMITVSRGASTVRWYKNGVFSNSSANSYPTAVSSVSTINIGSGYAGPSFQGNIYFVALYDRQLSDSEIFQNYNALRGRYGL